MHFGQHNKASQKYSLLIIVLSALFFCNIIPSQAQGTFWSNLEKIPEYFDGTEEPPYLIADQDHVVHAFNSQPLDLRNNASPKAIFYRKWTMENGWTLPNDVLYDDNAGSIELVDVVSDQSYTVHLVLQRNSRDLYYVYNQLAMAGTPASWSSPILIAQDSTSIGPGNANIGTIAADETGNNIVVVYSGSEYGDGLYFVLSVDHGLNWSIPYPVYLVGGDKLVVTDPKLYVGQSGSYHAVWSSFNSDGSGGPGYYANWDSISQSWSDPVELDVPGIRTPAVIEFNGDVFVSYYHVSSNGNWWRRSNDGGNTWSAPARVSSSHVGTNGGLSFVVDSNNTLNAFFGERIDDFNHGLWQVIWTGTSWSNPSAVVRGPQVRDVIGGRGFDPRSARAVVSNGNVVLVTWGTDGFAGVNGAWYSYKTLDAPELPSQPLVIPTVNNQSTQNAVATETVIEITPLAEIDIANNDYPEFLQSPQFPIYLGVIPVLVILIGIIIARYLFHFKNK
jgi:hypothetical protein